MMSREEVMIRAKQLVREGRLIEAAWVSMMERRAPDDVTDTQLRMVKLTFYKGAEAMLDIVSMAAEIGERNPKAGDRVVENVKAELDSFLRQQKHLRDQLFRPQSESQH